MGCTLSVNSAYGSESLLEHKKGHRHDKNCVQKTTRTRVIVLLPAFHSNSTTHFPFFLAGASPFASASSRAFFAAILAARRAASLQFRTPGQTHFSLRAIGFPSFLSPVPFLEWRASARRRSTSRWLPPRINGIRRESTSHPLHLQWKPKQ